MKNILINNKSITRDNVASRRLNTALLNEFHVTSSLFITGSEIFSDAKYDNEGFNCNSKHKQITDGLIQYVLFIGNYLDLILADNPTAELRKESPYAIFVTMTIDFEFKKAKIHFFLDGDIFGLVAGTGYVNIVNFIKTSFPIFSKFGLEVEVKLFSLNETQESSFGE